MGADQVWNLDLAKEVVSDLCADAGFGEIDKLKLLRSGTNLTFGHTSGGVVFRIAPPWADRTLIAREVAIASFLASVSYPAVRLSEAWGRQPLETAAGPLTAWRYVSGRLGSVGDYSLLGVLLSELHALSPPAGLVPEAQDVELALLKLDDLHERARSSGLDREHQFMVDAVRRSIAGSSSPFHSESGRRVFCHGDAHPGNMIVTPSGDPVLLDFEFAGLSAIEWDLSEPLVHSRRFGVSRDCWRAVLMSYSSANVSSVLLEDFLRAREVKLAAWAFSRGLRVGVGLSEAVHRVKSLMDGASDVRWSRL